MSLFYELLRLLRAVVGRLRGHRRREGGGKKQRGGNERLFGRRRRPKSCHKARLSPAPFPSYSSLCRFAAAPLCLGNISGGRREDHYSPTPFEAATAVCPSLLVQPPRTSPALPVPPLGRGGRRRRREGLLFMEKRAVSAAAAAAAAAALRRRPRSETLGCFHRRKRGGKKKKEWRHFAAE